MPGSDWSAYILSKLNIGALIPQLTAFLNSLFPEKVAPSTFEQGEAPTPPQPLCAQGIVQVTVAEVQGEKLTADEETFLKRTLEAYQAWQLRMTTS